MSQSDPADGLLKSIYLVQRKPGVDRNAFVRRWRTHGSLGMSMERWKNVKRYSHCDIRGELNKDGQFVESAFDGFGMIWYRSPEHRAAHITDKVAQEAMVADERKAFAELVDRNRLLTIERCAIAKCEVAGAKAIRLIQWDASMDDAAALKAWQDYSRRFGEGHDEVSRHVFHSIVENAREQSALHCQAVDELGFCTTEALRRLATADDLTTIADAAGRRLGTARVFATTEVVLYDLDYGAVL
jgi:EthD domain